MIDAKPNINKNLEPINPTGPNGRATIKEKKDIVNKINPLTTVNIVIITIPKGVFF